MNERNEPGSYVEPDIETVKRREIIVAMADCFALLDAVDGQSLALKTGFPLELVPMLREFTLGQLPVQEILRAWAELNSDPSNQ